MKIALCLPWPDKMHRGCALDYGIALAHHAATTEDDLAIHQDSSTVLSHCRQKLARVALEDGADYLIFIDADQRFPKDLIKRLTQHDVPVVAANISKRVRPIGPTARRECPDDPSKLETIFPSEDKTGLERAATVGFGIIGIKAEVFHKIEWPWFMQPWVEETQKFLGEDVFFCHRLKQAGIPLYIDHDLSWEVGHIGQYEYGMKDVLNERDLVLSGAWGDRDFA